MKRALKWAGIGTGGIIVLLLLVVGGLMGFTRNHLNRVYDVDPPPLAASEPGPAADVLTRGERLLKVRGCTDCHTADLGGGKMVDSPVFGRVWAANLTSGEGGIARDYEERDWVRAIRHGIGRDGRPLVFMPAQEFFPIGDADLAAMIARLEAAPPVDREIPPPRTGPVSSLLYVTGALPLIPAELIDHAAPRPAVPPPGPTPEYGAYLATSCVGCHGTTLSGGAIPGAPPGTPVAANITPDVETGLGSWTEADFVRALREGVRPDGRQLAAFMPVTLTREFTDMELEAIWKYLRTVEAKPSGNR